MTVLITGATGFIGSQLANYLAEHGTKVHALCRSAKKAAMFSHPNIRIFKGDVDDPASVGIAMEGCTEVYHLAAYTGVWHRDKDYYHRINVQGTQTVLDIAKEHKIQGVVVTSTAGVLGPSNEIPVDENSPVPSSFFTHYEESKYQMEQMILAYPEGGMRIVIVNPSRLYGPGLLNKSNSVTKMIVQYMRGKWRILPGNGRGIGNYAYIGDVVEGHVKAMSLGRHGERYLLGGENMSYLELFKRIDAITGSSFTLYSLPVPLMLATAWICKLGGSLTGIQPLITPGWVRKYNHHWQISVEKAKHEIGYRVTPYEDAIKEIINYFKV